MSGSTSGAACCFALSVAYLMTLCRRLSDIGWSKWWVLVIGLPIINLLFVLAPLHLAGKKDSQVEINSRTE